MAAVSAWAVGLRALGLRLGDAASSASASPAVLDAISLHPRYGSFAEGVVALANVVYFAALALVAMALARFSFDLRRVRG